MSTTNYTRIQIRTTEEEKAYFEQAAQRCGFKSLSEFIRVSAHEKARRDLKEFPESSYRTPTEPSHLSGKDSAMVMELLLKDQAPNALLKSLLTTSNEDILNQLLAKQGKD